MSYWFYKFHYRFLCGVVVFVGIANIGCRPPQNIAEIPLEISASLPMEPEPGIQSIIQTLESVSGVVARDSHGTIISVDLALERASATDETLRLALALPNLKKIRLAGNMISAEAFVILQTQSGIEELFLQDMSIGDEALFTVVSALPNLKRLTLRRLSNISDAGIIPLFRFPALQQLAFIEMPITGVAVQAIGESTRLVAFDVRNCAQLLPDDYKHLLRLPNLIDLKIGGFAVNDQCLEIVALLPDIQALTIDDSLISSGGFVKFVADSLSANTLETLVLNRNMALSDDALVAIANFPQLRRLILGEAMTTGAFLERLATDEQKRPKFNDIALRKTFLTEEAVLSLQVYQELQSLQISGSTLSRKGIETLLSFTQLERLDLGGCLFDDDARQFLQELGPLESLQSFRY